MKKYLYIEFDRYDGSQSSTKVIKSNLSLKKALLKEMDLELEDFGGEINVGKNMVCLDREETSFMMIKL